MAETSITTDLSLAPRLTYDVDEGILTLVTEPHEDPVARHNGVYERDLARAGERPGYNVAMDGLKSTLRVDINALREGAGADVDEEQAFRLLVTLQGTDFYDRPDVHGNYDSVFAPGGVRTGSMCYGVKGAVFPGLQRWLNDPERLTDEVAQRVLGAMASAYAEPYAKHALTRFSYTRSASVVTAGSEDLRITTKTSPIDLFIQHQYDETTWSWETPTWRLPSFSTYDAARLAPLPTYRSENPAVHSFDNLGSSYLYQLEPLEVGFNVQLLSLLLGAAQLAALVGSEPAATDTLHGPVKEQGIPQI